MGISIYEDIIYDRELIIKNNYIFDNSCNLYFYSLYNRTIKAEYNYWGTIIESEIDEKIDGNVDFNPWLDEKGNVCSSSENQNNKNIYFLIPYEFEIFILTSIIIIVIIFIWWNKKRK